jgi:hypothetical protein
MVHALLDAVVLDNLTAGFDGRCRRRRRSSSAMPQSRVGALTAAHR